MLTAVYSGLFIVVVCGFTKSAAAHYVEWPLMVRSSFDEAYLALPEVILVTSMREHQKVLPLRKDGPLAPYFVAVADRTGDPKGHVVRGNEWVINARFADARFFWEEDTKIRLEDRLARLGSLGFQERLGDYLRKTGRIQELAERLAARLGLSEKAPLVVRAARLAKTDLVTDMVPEFPDLQGIVGGLYARREEEPEEVWQALYDQYKPGSAEDDVPRGDVGGLVALAGRRQSGSRRRYPRHWNWELRMRRATNPETSSPKPTRAYTSAALAASRLRNPPMASRGYDAA